MIIRKYVDNYINLKKIVAVSEIEFIDNVYMFTVFLSGAKTVFEDENKERLESVRERLLNDWIAVVEKKRA